MNETILQQVRRGNAQAQRKLYYQHCDRLMALIYRYVYEIADAEEVLQDSFIRIFERIDSFEANRGSFEGWSARIAINLTLMFLRKKRKMIFQQEDLLALNQPVHNQAIENLQKEDLYTYIDSLEEKYAVIFKLKAIEGYSHQEIGQLLGIRSESSRTIFSRARKQLRVFLNQSSNNTNQIRISAIKDMNDAKQ